MGNNFNWDATTFFRQLLVRNKLAAQHCFTFCEVSGLAGFEDALRNAQESTSLFCVSDVSDGWTNLVNTPHTRRVKTVFMAMRHAPDDMKARADCMEQMRELFRQMMSVLIQERTKLEQNCIYVDPRITFREIERYFFTGCAAAYFQISTDTFTDLQYNANEWAE